MMVVVMTVMVVINKCFNLNVRCDALECGTNLVFLVGWNPSIQCKGLVCNRQLSWRRVNLAFTRQVFMDSE